MSDFQKAKSFVAEYYAALDGAPAERVADVIRNYTGGGYTWHGMHPFNDLANVDEIADRFWNPLRTALGPIQRREDIFMAGAHETDGRTWVMSMGHLMGLFDAPWLGIGPTGKMAFLRYADFNCVQDGRIVETGFFVDIIGLMRQAGINPLPLETGAEIVIPGPRTHDGLLTGPQDPAQGIATLDLVNRMKDDLVESYGTVVQPDLLRRTWHEDMLWYGPTGIGSTYTIDRYQRQHQWPFREGLGDLRFNGHVCSIAEGHYAAWFGWPNLTMKPLGGFLGMPASDREVHMRVVDVYRRDGDKLAENWIFIDLLYWLDQQGVDVLGRLRHIADGGASLPPSHG